MEVIEEAAEVPFVASIDCGLAVVTPDMGSALVVGHGPALCVFFLAAAVPQELKSPAADMGTPLGCDDG